MMLLRTLPAAALCIACLCPGSGATQVVECPGSLAGAAGAPLRDEAKALDLLQRFIGALDLHDRRAVSASRIMARYEHRLDELMSKLLDLDNQCLALAKDGRRSTTERQHIMRRRFLETILTMASRQSTGVEQVIRDVEADIQQALVEQSRQRWFQEPKAPLDDSNRWAVIVASPAAATAWDALKRHHERWPKMHFELHVPYDSGSPHYAVVAGRRLSEKEASTLVDSVRRAGLAPDSYKIPLPMSMIAKRLPVDEADDRSGARIAAVERIAADPPASDDRIPENVVVIPAQFESEARPEPSLFGGLTAWLSKLIGSKEVLAADYLRPNCGFPPSEQRAGVSFCARDHDSDRGSGGSSSSGPSEPDPPERSEKNHRDHCERP